MTSSLGRRQKLRQRNPGLVLSSRNSLRSHLSADGTKRLPHNGAVVTLLAVCGVSHRDGYLDIFMVAIVGALVALVAVILLGSALGSF